MDKIDSKALAMSMINSVNEKCKTAIATIAVLVDKIKWKTVVILIDDVPKPSARPRLSGYRIYVPNAHKHASFFDRHVRPLLDGLFITTPCSVKLDIFVPTPKSFSVVQKCLAEMDILKPWTHCGDVDNFAKTAMDMIQPNEKERRCELDLD